MIIPGLFDLLTTLTVSNHENQLFYHKSEWNLENIHLILGFLVLPLAGAAASSSRSWVR